MPSDLKKAVRKIGRPRSNAISLPSSTQVTKVYLDCTPPLFETFLTADHPPEPLKESVESVSGDEKQGEEIRSNKVHFASQSPGKTVEADESSSSVNTSAENAVNCTEPNEAVAVSAGTERETTKPRKFCRPLNVGSRMRAISAAKHGICSLKPSDGRKSGEKDRW